MIEVCAACGSKRLVRSIHRAIEGLSSLGVGAYAPSSGVLAFGFGQTVGGLRAVACVDCGNVQWFATDKARLEGLYEEQRQNAMRLSEVEHAGA